MPPRLTTRPTRENDFSDVGKVGRRTGVTLPQGRLDVNGMEEISGIFSSPRKPSPLRKSVMVMESVEETTTSTTPAQTRSTRKSIPPPRSASPRKSGISGTAKRTGAVDLFNQSKEKESVVDVVTESEIQPVLTPGLRSSAAKRFSPEKTPRKDVTSSVSHSTRSTRRRLPSIEDSVHDSVELEQPATISEEVAMDIPAVDIDATADDYVLPAVGDDDDQVSIPESQEDAEEELLPPIADDDDEDVDQSFAPETRSGQRSRIPTVANSRKKRKSETLEQELEAEAISSPAAKRAKRISDQSTKPIRKAQSPEVESNTPAVPKKRGRPALKDKDANTKMSAKQQNELNGIIEKVKARPGQKKSLYVLRRETPAEDGVTHTRSGRISVKPLAYWRNEKCVYGGSPGGISLQDGARFPLNSIKEIIRTEEVVQQGGKKLRKGPKGVRKNVTRVQSADVEEESDDEMDEDHVDPEAEDWETEKGIFRGPVAVWDSQEQTAIDEDEEIDLAYAPASIETREVRGSSFRYAKLLSSKFFGSGIVDLPPGGVKKTKNSRRMHMSFFVATGRVTVVIGPVNGPENRFSIGKGGWWQVPRGNQYSIENELSKPARVFFSQACEPLVEGDDV